jgi:hypothetical protein
MPLSAGRIANVADPDSAGIVVGNGRGKRIPWCLPRASPATTDLHALPIVNRSASMS